MNEPIQEMLLDEAPLAGRYQLLTLLGEGASGQVFLARDLEAEMAKVAVKILYPHLGFDEYSFTRFRIETRVTMKLSHPNILQTYGLDTHREGLWFLIMEYFNGVSLQEYLHESESDGIPFLEIMSLLNGIINGLSYAHRSGVVHRDLKPENILIGRSGELKLGDFGLAQMLRQEVMVTGQGNVLGTPHYMSPEQIMGEIVDEQSDIYALGIICFQMATGSMPFEAKSFLALADLHLNQDVPPIAERGAEVPSWFQSFVDRCTARSRGRRYLSLDQAINDLRKNVPERKWGWEADSNTSNCKVVPVSMSQELLREPLLYSLQRNSTKVYRNFLVIAAILSIFVAPHVNSSARWRYWSLVFSVEKFLDTDLPVFHWLFDMPFTRSDEYLMFDTEGYKSYVLPLLAGGASPNTRNEIGQTPLHIWIQSGYTERITGELIYRGADLNAQDYAGNTPLAVAVNSRVTESVRFLLKHGADASIANTVGLSPLHRAVRAGEKEIIRMILDYGGLKSLDLFDYSAQTPLHYAVRGGDKDILHLLANHGASPDAQKGKAKSPRKLAEDLGDRDKFCSVFGCAE